MNPPLHWITLDALQMGALLALAASFGADALHRKDRMMGWLALSCLLVSLRHTAWIFGYANLLPVDAVERIQSSMASLGFLAFCIALYDIFRPHFPMNLPAWYGVVAMANQVRCVFLTFGEQPEYALRWIVFGSYPAACFVLLVTLRRAFRAKDPMGRRLQGGLVITTLIVIAEITAKAVFAYRLPISGLGMMLLAITIGVSWFWMISYDLRGRLEQETKVNAGWRSLMPGHTWRTSERSPIMETLFGENWAQRMQDQMIANDGNPYLLHRVSVEPYGEVGWLEMIKNADETITEQFLSGWKVALGVDEGEDFHRLKVWLETWGAEVESWGTVPPREGPFPSLLIWGREPSILSVWREYDLVRRRSRWVQLGGAQIEGPHVRLDRSPDRASFRNALEGLLAPH